MKIADLFVDIGVKGEGSAFKALVNVRSGMTGVSTAGLEAKAAILAVIYGLEHMTSQSAKMGMTIRQFSALTGASTDFVGRWQAAGRNFSVTLDDILSGITAVQKAGEDIAQGRGMPRGMAQMNESLQSLGLGVITPDMLQNHQEQAMEQMRLYVLHTKDTAAKINDLMGSMGVHGALTSAMHFKDFDPGKARADYTKGQVEQLAKVEAAWTQLWAKVERAFGHFTSRHGLTLISDISKLIPKVEQLAEKFEMLGEKIKVFDKIGNVFTNIGAMTDWASGAVDAVGGSGKQKSEARGAFKAMGEDIFTKEHLLEMFFPAMSLRNAFTGVNGAKAAGNTTNLTIHNNGVKDAEHGAHLFHESLQKAHRSLDKGQAN